MIPWLLVWGLSVLAGAVLAAWTALSVRRILFPMRRIIPAPTPTPSYRVHALRGADGRSFDLWILEPPRPPIATVLGFHGYYANRHQLLGLAGRLCARGYEVLLMELRGHGTRPGPYTLGRRETPDGLTALAWACGRPERRGVPIALLGWSMGAAVTCQIAAREPAVRAMIADSMYSRFYPILVRVIFRRFKLGPVPWAWLSWAGLGLALGAWPASLDPATLAPHLSLPLLLIQGGADPVVAPSNREVVYARWAGAKERWVEPQVGHVQMFEHASAAYVDRVDAFLRRAVMA